MNKVDDLLEDVSNLFLQDEVEIMKELEAAIRVGNEARSSILAIKLAERKTNVLITKRKGEAPSINVVKEEETDEEEELSNPDSSLYSSCDYTTSNKIVTSARSTGAIPKITRNTTVTLGDIPNALMSTTSTEALGTQESIISKALVLEEASCVTKFQWACEICTLINDFGINECGACGVECSEHQVFHEVQSTQTNGSTSHQESEDTSSRQHTYLDLLYLDMPGYVANLEPFTCSICLDQYGKDDGVMLRNCLHVFCKECMVRTIQHSEEPEVKCPYADDSYTCDAIFQDCEIRTLATQEIYDKHLAKSIRYAESQMTNTFHCKTPNCSGWCIYEDEVNFFPCPVCHSSNCLTCQAIHPGRNCQEYQEHLRDLKNPEGKITLEYLNEMVRKREAMHCPQCNIIIMKKTGCDALQCTMCRTEICWVTRGPRWGPRGRGDTSGGCRCKFNGQRCHPNCHNCH